MKEGKDIAGFMSKLKSSNIKLNQKNKKDKFENILHINQLDRVGGAAILAYRLSGYQNKNNLESKILVKEARSDIFNSNIIEMENDISEAGSDWISFGEKNGIPDTFYTSGFNLKNHRYFLDADIIHIHNIHKGYFSYLALPEISSLKPSIWTLHDMFPITGHCVNDYGCTKWKKGCGDCPDLNREVKVKIDNTALLWNLKKRAFKHSDITIVSPSKWLHNKLKKSILKNKDIRVIYNGVDEEIFYNYEKKISRNKLGLPEKNFTLLFIANGGVKNPAKGGNLIGDIFKKLKIKNLTFVCIGQKNSIHPDIISIPNIENENILALYLSSADLVLYPTQADNCPLIVLESLSCGTPVISFNIGGVPEILEHKKNGYIVKKKSLEDFVNGIMFFFHNKNILNKACSYSRSSILKKFTLKTMSDNYLDLYKEKYNLFFKKKYNISKNYKNSVNSLLKKYFNY